MGGGMTGNEAKTLTADEKSLVEVHRKTARIRILQRISVPSGFLGELIDHVDHEAT